jgi:hypothetical protein
VNVQAGNALPLDGNNVVNSDLTAVYILNHRSGVVDEFLCNRVIPRRDALFKLVTPRSKPREVSRTLRHPSLLIFLLFFRVILHVLKGISVVALLVLVMVSAPQAPNTGLAVSSQTIFCLFFAIKLSLGKRLKAFSASLHWMDTGSLTSFSSDTSTLSPEILMFTAEDFLDSAVKDWIGRILSEMILMATAWPE